MTIQKRQQKIKRQTFFTARTGHTDKHSPQLMHTSGFIEKAGFLSTIASTGHASMHILHLLHFLALIRYIFHQTFLSQCSNLLVDFNLRLCLYSTTDSFCFTTTVFSSPFSLTALNLSGHAMRQTVHFTQ
jgi:hypothetical protein